MRKLECGDCKYMFVCFYSEKAICRNPKERKRLVLDFRQQHQNGKGLIKKLISILGGRIANLKDQLV